MRTRPKPVARVNQTSSVSEFILLGLSSRPEDQTSLFILFLTMFLVTIIRSLLIILAIHSDPQLQTPMYFSLSFLSFTDICFTTTIVHRMLVNFLSEKTISYAGCLTQMYFIYALANTDSCLLAVMAFDRYVAICDPFHYITTMNHHCCVLLVAFSFSLPHLHSLLHTLLLNRLIFCHSNVIHHFLCDLSPLMKLSCSPTFVNEIVMSEGSVVLVTPFLCIIFSYLRIRIAVLKIPSAAGKRKAFSTCGSHLTVVALFYGSIFYVYLQPLSTYTARDHIATLVYTVLPSMLNPFIYSLRNRDLKEGLKKLVGRRKSQQHPLDKPTHVICSTQIWSLLDLHEN
ncbi:LOW QUALITY PROTEIN: olfactory receptor 1L8-like [Neovison vison]|uniref:LOW QUALITY PROTEIN: olfactory receptor 1L8-like n=1 Tax=Neovison vison TaxID=452646 RepID=UPI001CF01154|nr:LOW QUALITY PROTEIN: olfactory receptor 1L8-like [Neogale vison]